MKHSGWNRPFLAVVDEPDAVTTRPEMGKEQALQVTEVIDPEFGVLCSHGTRLARLGPCGREMGTFEVAD